MKRFDPVSAIFGLLFVVAGVYFLDASHKPSVSELTIVVPIMLIVGGLAVALRNMRPK